MDKTELETDIETQIETQIETETETGTEIVNEKQILQTRYKSNPFVKDMIIRTKNQTVTLSTLGKDNNVLVNTETGEAQGTHICTYKKVDSESFVKIFTAQIALTFDLSRSGIKTFNVLMWAVQTQSYGSDKVVLDSFTLSDFLELHKYNKLQLSLATFKRGLNELELAKIIAKTERPGAYFINPNFIFNGDRIAFTTMLIRDKESRETEETKENKTNKVVATTSVPKEQDVLPTPSKA